MIQGILVALIFTGAIAYLAWIVYKQLQAKAACSSGCGKCSVVDFKKIESRLRARGQ
ncbi:MAG: hypothetical protein WAZ98_14870 [Cyclobacteriaceae bacterium]